MSQARESICEYAQQYGSNPDTGKPYSLKGYEYLNDLLDCMSPRMVIQKSAQVGATVMAMLRTMWYLERMQKSAMYLFPTHRTAEKFRRGRFNVMVQRSPHFRDLLRPTGAPGHSQLGVAQFYCHGARSRAELMSVPVSYLTLDERDELYHATGMDHSPWSAVDLARQRLAGQAESWELSLSTPTIPGYGIAAEYARSDQREFVIQCPRCSKSLVPHWPESVLGIDGSPDRACYGCSQCGQPWSDEARRFAIQHGHWHASQTDRDSAGFHLTQLLSPVVTAKRMVKQWQEAQGNPAALQVFHNSVLGLPYLSEGARLEMSVMEDAITRGAGAVMASSGHGTSAGIDVGPQFLHVVITQPSGTLCRILFAGVVLEWNELEKLLSTYGVQSYVIDAQPETHLSRSLVQRRPGGWMCYYRLGQAAQQHADVTQHILRMPRSETLDQLYRLWNTGKVIAPVNLPAAFVEQLRSLVRVVRQDRHGQPRVDYLEAGGPDHYAHAMNYCLLAMGMMTPERRMEIG